MPNGNRIKRLVELLARTRHALSLHELADATEFVQQAEEVVRDLDSNSPRVSKHGTPPQEEV